MTLKCVLCAMFVMGLHGQAARTDDPGIRTTERTLAAVLRWEILWNDPPKGFRAPSDGMIGLAIYTAPESVSYCSHQAGVCVTYRADGNRNWEGANSAACDDNRSDEDSLLTFVGKPPRKPTGGRGLPLVLGKGGLSGSPAPDSGIIWTTKIALGSRAEIVRQYQQMHPAEIDGLKTWLGAPKQPDAGVKSITIACFAPTDPTVYYYIDRPAKGSVVMNVFWDKERQEWRVASSLERSQNVQRFDEIQHTIESVSCSTITFQ